MKVFVDTNIWVYCYDHGEPDKRERALQSIASREDADIVLSAQVLNEFFTVVTRRLAHPLDRTTAAAAVEALRAFDVAQIDGALVSAAVALGDKWSLSHWDALIVAAARRAGCDQILSEDLATGSTIAGITVVNPLTG